MDSRLKINENEAKILNIIGKNADLSNKEVASLVGYKRINTISRKLKKFEDINILKGPYYDLNLSAVGENQIFDVYTNVMFQPEYRELVFSVLEKIPGCRWIFPYTGLDRFFAYFQVNHYKHVGGLLKLLREKDLIEYQLFTSRFRWIKENPDFSGPPIPIFKGLLDPCPLPGISYSKRNTDTKWNSTDLIIMQYLQVQVESPMEIARREYKLHNNRITYNQIKYSIQKIKKNGIVESVDYHISPLPREKCSTLLLLLSHKKRGKLLQIMENFAKGCRLHKSYTLAGTTGIMFLWTYPEAATNILEIFDRVGSLHPRMYFLRSHGTPFLRSFSFEPNVFNVETQRWEFPYAKTKAKILKLIEEK